MREGNEDAEYNLGLCHQWGIGVEQDRAAAMQLYRQAAVKGHVSAQVAAADLLLRQNAREASLAEALNWFENAAEKGAPAALFALGRLHERGRGVPIDRERAIAFYKRAKEAGSIEAGTFLERLERQTRSGRRRNRGIATGNFPASG